MDVGPLQFINTVAWGTVLSTRPVSPVDNGALRYPAAQKLSTSQALPSEGIPPALCTRRLATSSAQSSRKELETLCSEPSTPPDPPSCCSANSGVVPDDGHGGDPRWQNSDTSNSAAPARSHSEWAAAGYVLLPAEDLQDERVQEMVTDWGALGYLQIPDGAEEDAVAPGSQMAAQDGPRSFGRWVMLRDTPSPLQLAEGAGATAVGGYIRLATPGASSQPESACQLAADEDEMEDNGEAGDCEEAEPRPRMASPTGEGCLPPAELDELLKEYAALPMLNPNAARLAEVAEQRPATTTKVETHDAVPPLRLGDRASGLPGLCFDFVTSAERCELYLTASHQQLEEVARSVAEKRGGEAPANWRVEVDLQRKSSKTLAASRPLLARGGASSDDLAQDVEEAWRSSGDYATKILSEAELPDLAAWGL